MPGRALAPGAGCGSLPALGLSLACALLPGIGLGAGCAARIDPAASSARFVVDVRLPIRAEGRFTELAGELRPADGGLCEVEVRLRADTVDYEGPEWMAKLTRSPAFLDAGAHPEVGFVSQPFPPARLHEGGPVRGRLRLRGRERPVDFLLLTPSCPRPGEDCPLRVQGSVSRRDFGMQAYRFTVKDEVRFEFGIRFAEAR
ncbi:YceI family protein [Silanimonas lenta]|mgnify:FL=1|uniref:YceI family protein n=1 Tax=Silanimonas lenta TaxID=265429 RepID=UPI002FE35E97